MGNKSKEMKKMRARNTKTDTHTHRKQNTKKQKVTKFSLSQKKEKFW